MSSRLGSISVVDKGLVLGVDLGTHGVKALCLDRKGQIISQGGSDYARTIGAGGLQEQPLAEMRTGLEAALRGCVAAVPDPARIGAIGVTHQRGTLVYWDSQGEILGNAICDSDTRSWPQAQALAEEIGEARLFRTTGCPPLPFVGLSKAIWLRDARPDLFRRVAYWGSVQDWAVHELTGQFASSPGSALRLGVLDIQQPAAYAEDLLRDVGLDPGQLIPLSPLGSVLGTVTRETADSLGLVPGLPVIAVPGDQPAGFIGTGATREGSAGINLGTSFLTSFPAGPLPELLGKEPSDNCTLEILPEGEYSLEWGSGAGTNVLDWMRDILFELESVGDLDRLLLNGPDHSAGITVLPYWWSAQDGQAGSISGLQPSHGRGDLVRAVFRSLAFEVRRAWEVLSARTGLNPEGAALFGGASSNDYLCQLLADVLGRPTYRVETSQVSAFGAAVCAASGIGWYDDTAQAVGEMVTRTKDFQPQRDFHSQYEEYIQLSGHHSLGGAL